MRSSQGYKDCWDLLYSKASAIIALAVSFRYLQSQDCRLSVFLIFFFYSHSWCSFRQDIEHHLTALQEYKNTIS